MIYFLSNIHYFFIQDDDEGHLAVFNCVQDMMNKGPNIFLIHFIRLGVLQKISEMASQFEIVDQDVLIDGKIQEKVFLVIIFIKENKTWKHSQRILLCFMLFYNTQPH